MGVLAQISSRFLYSEYGRALIIRPAEGEDTDALFERVCASFENTKIEQDSEGNVRIMAPAGGESSAQNSELTTQLQIWAKQDGRGRAFDSSVLFILPDRSRLSPDGAWVRTEKLATLTPQERRKFLGLVPDFVVEIKSPTDHLSDLQQKMQDWKRNGVELGWLIDPDKRTVWIYRAGADEPQICVGLSSISGEGPVAGFILDLFPIWKGLDL